MGSMSPRFARVRPDMTVDEAISYLRKQRREHVETINYAYVLDDQQHLLGVVSIRELFSADPRTRVRDVMRTQVVTVTDQQDQEVVSKVLADHNLIAVPVVDAEGRMRGIVTFDDVVDVVREEATEDIQRIGGMEALDAPYMRIGFWRMMRKRGSWLSALFLGEMLTATAMGFYEHEIARAVVLALFVPLIISSGGNSGSQATTLVIRAMALGEVRIQDWWRVIRRELGAGSVLGSLLGSIGFLRIILWQMVSPLYGEHYVLIAFTVAFSLIGVVTFGTLAGSLLPFVLRSLKFDPGQCVGALRGHPGRCDRATHLLLGGQRDSQGHALVRTRRTVGLPLSDGDEHGRGLSQAHLSGAAGDARRARPHRTHRRTRSP